MAQAMAQLNLFCRSTRLERDCNGNSLAGYIPTPRGLELLRQLMNALDSKDYKAFSVTGPYGSGKSSYAVFLTALLGDPESEAYVVAAQLLEREAPELAEELLKTKSRVNPGGQGFVVARATADRKPLVTILRRALLDALRDNTLHEALRKEQSAALNQEECDDCTIIQVVRTLCGCRSLVLCIDEFGKALEWFSEHQGNEGDLYLLQQLIELSEGSNSFPLVLITLQHLAFDDYAADAAALRQREWAKIQGRFRDFPFTDSSHSTGFLMVRFLERLDLPKADRADAVDQACAELGLLELTGKSPSRFTPLHPLSALLLPELCSKYGQHERSMFKFLGSSDEGALQWLVSENHLHHGWVMPWHLYDYFLASTAGTSALPNLAQRWIEIHTRIRDAVGLTKFELTILKTVGIFNLCTSAGPVRASSRLLRWLLEPLAPAGYGYDVALEQLQASGFLTYRVQVDEYRLWRGSDFDLGEQVRLLMASQRQDPLDRLLGDTLALEPVIATRHSQQRCTVRLFQQVFASRHSDLTTLKSGFKDPDGLLIWWVGEKLTKQVSLPDWAPTAVVIAIEVSADLRQLVSYVRAYKTLLNGAVLPADDWVARREAQERLAVAQQKLQEQVVPLLQLRASSSLMALRPRHISLNSPASYRSITALLSEVCDRVYPHSPRLPNEMLARRELTSQGAKARRMLIEAFAEHSNQPLCGLKGHGPERAMFDAVLGLHGLYREGQGLAHPFAQSDLVPAYGAIDCFFKGCQGERRELTELWQCLKSPPFGMMEGPIPVLVAHYLFIHDDTIGLYEDGAFVPTVDTALVERLAKRPASFACSSFALEWQRKSYVSTLLDALGIAIPRNVTLLHAVKQILRLVRRWPNHSRHTQQISDKARSLRKALLGAKEPDLLLFADLPKAVGFESFEDTLKDGLVAEISRAFAEVNERFDELLAEMRQAIGNGLNCGNRNLWSDIAPRAERIKDQILDPKLRAFALALADQELQSERDWLQRVGLSLLGRVPTEWIDADVQRFHVAVNELAPAFRRIEALHFTHQQTSQGGFLAIRIGVTTTDGHDTQQVVSIPQEHHEALTSFVQQLQSQAHMQFGDQGASYALAVWAQQLLRQDMCQYGVASLNTALEQPKRRSYG